ncbi:6-pyruvoyl-tetrahydropterin synthase-related protein [Deinococcus yavapaiensis]|uniref:6-pyruvoyl-tetrahydropterin synthase-like protein n=1 Tax=Deinococcus yavapaiensis KR-236 TaxID=694435 RepID=A0A318RZS1_9DEIO|nr:6-pyruvoyl-tetrahydropterin synthase-related protein [Deinococcus yavapaiensis]PYE49904.1 6-pyruvoyl-tetrahydropterin synthase-like protein [Deinococcus yavapaiensis KR-236]
MPDTTPPRSLDSPSAARDGPRLLAVALVIVLLLHGTLLFGQSFVRTYDALIHIFFASHYAQNWFDPWEPRWYTGFWLVSYPPLAHYLIALASKLVDLKTAFAVVQLFALLALTVGVYRFSRLVVPARAAGYACVALALSSSIAETVHVFGQLPTTLSLAFLLNAIPFGWAWVRDGDKRSLVRAVLWMAATTAGHHVTTLFGSVFFTAPTLLIVVLAAARWRDLPTGRRRWTTAARQVLPRAARAALFAVLTVMTLVVVVLPYWLWSRADPISQVPIPHASRENFLSNTNAGLVFWLIPWASTLLFLPFAWSKARSWRWPLVASLTMLFVLGTGGTTPLPRLLLRGAFDILTLDRFTFWATILILPFVGLALESVSNGTLRAWLAAVLTPRGRDVALALLLVGTVGLATTIGNLTRYRKFQPEPIDINPIVSFLDKDLHWRYRYLTLGFGDQMAWLSANTRASTPDGDYHSARRLPELTATPIERLEGAKFSGPEGLASLRRFLTVPEKYNLKFVFSNDAFYDPLLYFSGWQRLGTLENGIALWEREDIPPLPERLERPELPPYQVAMWGILPLSAPILAFLSLALGSRAVKRDDLLDEPSTSLPSTADRTPSVVVVRRIRGGLLLMLLVAGGAVAVVAWRAQQAARSPARVVTRYWDALDFRRFGQAYGLVDPRDDLTEERWLLDLSVQGGLRTGYAKLSDIDVQSVSFAGKPGAVGARAIVQVRLNWFTALGNFTDVVRHDLRLTPAGWRITTRPLLQARPPARFLSQPDVDYAIPPRRFQPVGVPGEDVLDRPRLVLGSVRLVSFTRPSRDDSGRQRELAMIGTLTNVDARPADTTVTGVLRDEGGRLIARNNVETGMIHKLLPGETTPFVLRFDAVDEVVTERSVASASVDAKGVVTGRDLWRRLGAWTRPSSTKASVTVVNVGTDEATIGHVLVGLYDARGLAWVEEAFLPRAVAPGDQDKVRVNADLPPDYRVVMNVRRSVEGLQVADEPPAPTTFPLGDGRRFAVWLHDFGRAGR